MLSCITYYFVENKTRNYKHTPKIVLAGIILIAGLTIYFKSDFYKPYYDSKYNQQFSYAKFYDISPTQSSLDANDPRFYKRITPARLSIFNDAYKKEGIITNKKYGTPKIILIGDSHGVMWAKLLNEISDEMNMTFSSYTSNGNAPFFNIKNINSQNKTKSYSQSQRIEYAKSIVTNIEKWEPYIVVLACRWETINGTKEEQFIELLDFLEKRNVKVLLFNQPPVLNFMVDRNASQYFTYLGLNPVKGSNFIEGIDTSRVTKSNNHLEALGSKYTNLNIYNVYNNMLKDDKIKISLDNEVLYSDDDHLSTYGTYTHKENISSLIKNIIN